MAEPAPCPSGKIPHDSIESAESHIRQVEARDVRRGRAYPGRGKLRPYTCPFCARIHVGHSGRSRTRDKHKEPAQ